MLLFEFLLFLFVARADPPPVLNRVVTICADYQVDFADSDTVIDAGDDYYTTNSNKDALGVQIRLVPTSGTTQTQHASDTDGCVVFSLDPSLAPYQIQIWSKVSVNANSVHIMNDNTNRILYSVTPRSSYTLVNGETVNVNTGTPNDAWNAAAALG